MKLPAALIFGLAMVAACKNEVPTIGAASAPASTGGPIDQLNALDSRTPVPLQPMMAWHQKQNMMEHLVAIQRITAGLASDDWSKVAEASRLIEASPQMKQMCQHMGAGAPGFTEMGLNFHREADAIGAAAKIQDKNAALAATARTLQACTTCHATYKQQIVDARTWQQRTGEMHRPTGQGHPPR